ncbi:hypothetical protein [Paludisphaera soli]|uniref:hypothetical protein n=1 Tax=Paludisphaera soli TaxID=2712865 RepID=UPI0013EA26B9|nr:hypothetical protein [Paludisphaera soli]
MERMHGESPGHRITVVIHERTGAWARRLRTRIDDTRVSWFETRTTAELLDAIAATSSPVVLIEVGPDPERALRDLAELQSRCNGSLILVLDPADRPSVRELAAEFGAVHAASGSVTPPEVAGWLDRWIALGADRIAREGWTRVPPADPILDPVAWLAEQEACAERRGPDLES